jgi:LAGLIDADG endonuclease
LKSSSYIFYWSLSAGGRDQAILELIKSYFGVGSITGQGKDSVQFKVNSTKIFKNIIIPHFNKYPLITQKRADFILFKKAVNIINPASGREHLTIEGIKKKIVAIKVFLNLFLNDELKKAFPNTTPEPRPLVEVSSDHEPN